MSAVSTQRTSAESFNTEIGRVVALDSLKKVGYWIIALLIIGGFLLRLFDGPFDSYNRRCIYGITPEFIYWGILVSTVGGTVAAWYGDVRKWRISLKDKIIWSVGLSMVLTAIFTLFFSFTLWFCGDDPRYREDKVGEVLNSSEYEMYVSVKVPTPSIISH